METSERPTRPTAIHVRLTQMDREAIAREAARRGLTLSELARRCLLVVARGLPIREQDIVD